MHFFSSELYCNIVDTGVLTLLILWFILDRNNIYFKE